MTEALSSNQSWCRLFMLPRVDCEAIRRAEERAFHSMERFEVQFNVVVVDMRDKHWSMALRSSSLMFWLWAACTLSLCLGFCLHAGGRTVSRSMERIRRWSVEHSAPRMARVFCTWFKSRRLTMMLSMRCQCLNLGCIQEVLCMLRSWKKCLWWQDPIQSRKKAAGDRYYSRCQQHDVQRLHAICCDFCLPWHWNRTVIWFCHLAKFFGGWNTTCHKSDLSHHQMSLMLENRHLQR